ncbi:hypothetical protein HDG35_000541 [Paraburkholderia sp. JPY681]|nr:hypothetical protein [Paraburkholderia atlantica]
MSNSASGLTALVLEFLHGLIALLLVAAGQRNARYQQRDAQRFEAHFDSCPDAQDLRSLHMAGL